ncbi:MAG: ribosome silencing factor [Myxococcales bacterium]|nr:ribosome silencing factor [Myxococcales bacterium]
MTSTEQALLAVDAALSKKALDPVLLDVSSHASYTDFILVLSGTSDRHVQTIADAVIEEFARLYKRPIGVEGQKEGQWALIDFGDLVVHVFYHPMRDFYDLEGLWCDAPRVTLAVPPEARARQMY